MFTGTATGWIGRDTGNVTSHATIDKYGNIITDLRKTLNRSHGSRRVKTILLALTGSAVGAVSRAYSVVQIDAGRTTGQAGRNELGGKRLMLTRAAQTGVTTAADLANLDGGLALKSRLTTYPADKSGWTPGNIGKL